MREPRPAVPFPYSIVASHGALCRREAFDEGLQGLEAAVEGRAVDPSDWRVIGGAGERLEVG